MAGQDVVYANLAGQLEQQARCIVTAMKQTGLKRLIFISSMGIYDEIPGERHGSILEPYCKSASIIEASGIDYTILRPAWLNDRDEIGYGTTRKGEPFKNAAEVVPAKLVRWILDPVAPITTRRPLKLAREQILCHIIHFQFIPFAQVKRP